jgi:hypothetical protein
MFKKSDKNTECFTCSLHFLFNTSFSENYTVYEIMWKIMVQPDKLHMTIECSIQKMCFACWITNTIIQMHTHNT